MTSNALTLKSFPFRIPLKLLLHFGQQSYMFSISNSVSQSAHFPFPSIIEICFSENSKMLSFTADSQIKFNESISTPDKIPISSSILVT